MVLFQKTLWNMLPTCEEVRSDHTQSTWKRVIVQRWSYLVSVGHDTDETPVTSLNHWIGAEGIHKGNLSLRLNDEIRAIASELHQRQFDVPGRTSYVLNEVVEVMNVDNGTEDVSDIECLVACVPEADHKLG